MRLGSFTLESTTVNVDTDYDSISGMVYKFVHAGSGQELAVTSYKGIKVADGVRFTPVEFQRGLDSVWKTARRR